MIKATKIVIDRAEGPSRLCGKRTFEGPDCWALSRNWLWSQSPTYPEKGGYDKHDYTVHFEDGETFEGRLDCKSLKCEDNDLDVGQHIRQFLTFMAGQRKPADKTPEEYAATVDRLCGYAGTTKEAYAEFLNKYELG